MLNFDHSSWWHLLSCLKVFNQDLTTALGDPCCTEQKYSTETCPQQLVRPCCTELVESMKLNLDYSSWWYIQNCLKIFNQEFTTTFETSPQHSVTIAALCYFKVTNEEVHAKIQQAIGPHEDLLTSVKRRKLQWYGHEREIVHQVWPKPSCKAQ